ELIRAALFRIVGVDDLLADVAAAGDVVGSLAPGRVLEEPPDSVADLVPAPLEVMNAVFLAVADGDHLVTRAGEHPLDFPDRLRSEADAGEGYLLAWRDVPAPAQNV